MTTATKPPTPTCSHCGEPRAQGREHDSRRCSTIALALSKGAYADNTAGECDEISQHIVELSRWLGMHPGPLTPMGVQARDDRRRELDRWVAKAQLT